MVSQQAPMFQVQQFTAQPAELLAMEMVEALALGMVARIARSFVAPALLPNVDEEVPLG